LRYSRISFDTGSGCRAAAYHIHSRHNENFGECERTARCGSNTKHG
jgi:hypothetical protein